MYHVYILYSLKDRKLYIGHTDNLKDRLTKHNNGEVRSTKNRRPLVLIYSEIFKSRSVAMRREKFLKSLYSAKLKKKILKDYLRRNSPK